MSEEIKNESLDGIYDVFRLSEIGELSGRVLIKEGLETIRSIQDADAEDFSIIEMIGENLTERIMNSEEAEEDDPPHEEVFCPFCDYITPISEERCIECDADLSMDGDVILPGGVFIKEPLKQLAIYDKEILEGEGDEDIWFGRGAINESLGAFKAALDSYDRVIEFDPLYDHIWNAKARMAMKTGRVNEAARAYKIAVDFHVEGLPSKMLKQEKKEGEQSKEPKQHDIDVKEVEENISKARRIITELEQRNVDTSKLEDQMGIAVKARNKDDRGKAVSMAEKVLEQGEELKLSLENIEKIEEKLAEAEVEQSPYSDKLDNIRGLIDKGLFKNSFSRSERLLDDIERGGLLEGGKGSDMVYKEKFEKRFEQAKDKIADARKTKIKVGSIKPLMREVIESKKEEDYDKALEKAEKVIERCDELLDVFEEIKGCKDKLAEMKKKGLEIDTHLIALKKAKKLADEGKYEQAKQDVSDISAELDPILDGTDGTDEESTGEISGGETEIEEEPEALEQEDMEAEEEVGTAEKEETEGSELGAGEEQVEPEEAGEEIEETSEDIKAKLKKTYNEIKNEYNSIKGWDVDKTGVKKTIKKGLEAKKEEEYEEAIEFMEEGLKLVEEIKQAAENEVRADEGGKEEESEIEQIEEVERSDGTEKEEGKPEVEQEVTKEDITKGLADIKSMIILGRDNDIDIEKSGDIINKIMKNFNEENYQRAYEELQEGNTWIRKTFDKEIEKRISDLEKKIKKCEEGEDLDEGKGYISDIKEMEDDYDYKEVFKLISKADYKLERAKGSKAVAEDKITSVERLLKDVKEIGMECEEAYEFIEEAWDRYEEGKLDEIDELTSKAENLIMDDLPEVVDRRIDECMEEIKESRISGQNTSKLIYLVKEARESKEKGEWTSVLDYFKMYEDEMKDLVE
ncbi:MAG: hypothetical protein ACQESD_01450 [Thermoplasmatota archaeon]